MAEKLTMKRLAEELDTLSKQLARMETHFERKLEGALEKATEKLKSRLERAEGRALSASAIDGKTRRRLIEQSAYLRAERRGFIGGDPQEDWLAAEMEIDHLLLQSWRNADDTASGESASPGQP